MLLFCLAFVIYCACADHTQFTCDFTVSKPGMDGNLKGRMDFDFKTGKMLHTFTSSGAKELTVFNLDGTTNNQLAYKWNTDKCACEVERHFDKLPLIVKSNPLCERVSTPPPPTPCSSVDGCSLCVDLTDCCADPTSTGFGKCTTSKAWDCPGAEKFICNGGNCPAGITCKTVTPCLDERKCYGSIECGPDGCPDGYYPGMFCHFDGASKNIKVCCSQGTGAGSAGESSISTNSVDSITGFPASITFKNGRVYSFSNCKDTTFADSVFTPPSDCKCNNLVDMVLAVDRSNTVKYSQFIKERELVNNFVNTLSYGPLAVNLGMVNYHSLTWNGPLNLNQGNNLKSAQTGALAFQCAPDAQCKTNGDAGECCGAGSCIGCAIVSGADMLATQASSATARAGAAKVLVVFTDGVNDHVLKVDASGKAIRDASGNVQGTPSKDTNALNNDIASALAYARATVPGVVVIAVGAGPKVNYPALLRITGGVYDYVVSSTDWAALPSVVTSLMATTCPRVENTGCCGISTCECIGPDACPTEGGVSNAKVTQVTGNPNCATFGLATEGKYEPPKAGSGQVLKLSNSVSVTLDVAGNLETADFTVSGGSVSHIIVKAGIDSLVYDYNGLVGADASVHGPARPQGGFYAISHISFCWSAKAPTTDAATTNACDTTSVVNGCCKTVPTVCSGDDKCMNYSCDRSANLGKGGCVATPIALPADEQCLTHTCDPATGAITAAITCTPVCTVATGAADCNDNNACTTDSCVLKSADIFSAVCSNTLNPESACAGTDKCKTYSCDPATGCVATAIPLPTITDGCSVASCDPATGVNIDSSACPVPECKVNADCNDNNACTVDECVRANEAIPSSWVCKRTSVTCDDSNACTVDSCSAATGCVYSPKPVPAETSCLRYSCDPATGTVSATEYTPCAVAACVDNAGCNDNNACTNDVCVNPGNVATARCTNELITCNDQSVCTSDSCDAATGCVFTALPLPTPTDGCTVYSCNAATGLVTDTSACPIPECFYPGDCNDNNACTTDSCELADMALPTSFVCKFVPNAPCVPATKCETSVCDPAIGCVSTPVPLPANTDCITYSCNPTTGEIVSVNSCPPPTPLCVADADCDDSNACTVDTCFNPTPGDSLSAKCVHTPVDVATSCDDKNVCTVDTCEPATGCVHTDIDAEVHCNDNDACTVDTCTPGAATLEEACAHNPVVCDPTDICHESVCDPAQGCLVVDIVCPTTDNCTISGCNVTNDVGCYVDDSNDCGVPVALVAGLTAGVVAGVVIAAVAAATAVGGGTAYAFTAAGGNGLNAVVAQNPIYQAGGNSGVNPLSRG